MTDLAAEHDDLRPLMFSVAYGMLGSVADAEDITQEALLRLYHRREEIRTPAAYAVTVTTRLAIDQLRSAQARREVYVGTWLPEPLTVEDPATEVEAAERLSMAFLVMLERLSPVERAVLLLRDVFSYDYPRIAEIVEKSPENCRQILTRARGHVREPQARFTTDPAQHGALLDRFFAAARSGDLAALEQLLAADIAFRGDGGGKAPAVSAPVIGRRRVARFILGLFRQLARYGIRAEPALVNGAPGGHAFDHSGQTVGVFALDVVDGQIVAVHNVINPDKLAHLPRVST